MNMLTPYDIAEYLQVSYETALDFIKHSNIPYIKVGRQYLKNALADGRVKLTPFNEVKFTEAAEFDVNSPLADKVRTIAAPILGVEKEDIGPDTHVMHELGASSLQYFTLLTELSKEFPIDYSDSNNYFYTLRDFCEYIERQI